MDFGIELEDGNAGQDLQAHRGAADAETEEDDAFDLYGDIEMDLVSSRPMNAANKTVSGDGQSVKGGRTRPDGQHSTLRLGPLLGRESAPSSLQQASTPLNPAVKPSPAIALNPPATTAGLNSGRTMPPTESGGLPTQSQQPPSAKVTASPPVVPAVPKSAAAAPLTSAALASEYMARHGLGGHGAQPMARGAPQLSKEPMQVYVGELNWWTTDEEVERALGEYGLVKELRLFEEKANGKFKGYCQAEFFDADAAKACKEKMNGRVFTGRPCVVTFASTGRPRQASEAVPGPSRVEHDGRGAGGRGEGGAGRGPGGRGGFSEPSTGGVRPHGHGREGAGRGGYPGRGMEFGGAGAQMWDPGYAGGGGGFGRDGWGKGPYSQWGGAGYGAQGWEMDGANRGPYRDPQGWYEGGPPWGWVGPNPEKRKREVE